MKEVQHNKIHIVREMITGNPKKLEHESKENTNLKNSFWLPSQFLPTLCLYDMLSELEVNPNSVYCGTMC